MNPVGGRRDPLLGLPCHIGLATLDLDRAMELLGEQFGLEWDDLLHVERAFVTSTGVVTWALRRVHSSGGPMKLELLEGSPASVWATTEIADLHHFAYVTDNLVGDAEALNADGWLTELTFPGPGSRPTQFAYFTRAHSPRIELLERTLARRLDEGTLRVHGDEPR